MDKRAAISLGLLAVGLCAGVFVATGIGSSAPSAASQTAGGPGPSVPRPEGISALATSEELQLWSYRGCITCHGPEARGTQMGPDLFGVIPLYLTKFGSAAAAREPLVAYMFDPKGSPKLRDDGEEYQNTMPSIAQLAGGTRAEAGTIADMLLRIAR